MDSDLALLKCLKKVQGWLVIWLKKNPLKLLLHLHLHFKNWSLKKNLPPNIDTQKLEIYLSDEEFMQVFEMDKATWGKKSQWQKIEIKKKVGLY